MFKIAALALAAFLIQGCSSQPAGEREPSAIKPPQQAMAEKHGYTLRESNSDFLRFSFRDQGDFLISKKGFRNRPLAEGFCSVRKDYELTDITLPELLSRSDFPIEELRKQNRVRKGVLSQGKAGYLFWVKGATVEEEARLSRTFDSVLEFHSNCKANCTRITRLKPINDRLVSKLARRKEPLAICISPNLKKRLTKK